MNPEIFKQYDIRGVYPSDLNETDASIIAYQAANLLSARNCIIGFDSRRGSRSIAEAIGTTLASAGMRIVNLGLVSTPEFYFSVAKEKMDMGVMVTASHNPKQFNGLKIVGKGAFPITFENGMRDIMERSLDYYELNMPSGKGELLNRSFRKEFIAYSLSQVSEGDISKLEGTKIVVDASSGAIGPTASEFFSKLPVEVVKLNFEPDPEFPSHSPNPMDKESTEMLSKRVVEEGAVLGIIFDGDGDRVLFVDERGLVVRADTITALLAEEICLSKPRQKILYDLRSSKFVPEAIKAAGGIPLMCRIGHSLIKKRMREEKASFAGELSGHYYYPILGSYFENSLLTSLQILIAVSKRGKLSELASRNRYFQSGELNFEAAEKERIIREVHRLFEKEKLSESSMDGLLMEFGSWRFSLRASNTEPLLRLNIEADSEELLNQKRDILCSMIKKFNEKLIKAGGSKPEEDSS